MGWLFGNKDNSRTETKTVNDNGKLKELQLTITGPDSTMVVTGDEYRTTVPLRGNQPVAAEEVSIERKAPNGMWLNSLIPFYDGDVKGTQKKARSLWQLPAVEGKSQGGWMNKFQNGGSTQSTQDQAMKELMAIVQQAATELQSNKPGQGVQTLAQIANDPQGSQLLDVLVQQVPEAGQIVEAVMKMIGAFKCGGKAKKKVKKGAKGCVPCKKLMRVGGKLVNVLTDCEGNIISKHQVGGYLIPKGQVGLTAQFVQEPYRKAKASTDTGNANDVHYYLGDDNKIYTQTYTAGTGWGAGQLADMNNFKNWATTPISGKILGKNFFVNGFNFDYNTNMGTMSETDAQAAGIDGSKYATAGKVVDGVVGAGGNALYGIEAKDPTKRDALNQRGLSPILNATFVKQNAANALAKEQFITQRRAVLRDKNLWGKGYLKNARNTKNTIIETNNAEASKDRATWMTEFGHMNTPSNTTPVEIPKYQPATGTTPAAGTTTGYQSTSAKYKKQGGWLTKFQDGGQVRKYKDGEKVYRKATPYESIQASPSVYATKEENGYTLPGVYLAHTSPDMWKWDAIAPTNIKFPLLKELIGYIPKTDAPIGRLIRTFNIAGLPNDTSYIIHSKKPFSTIQYENIEKGEDGYEDFQQLFKQTLTD